VQTKNKLMKKILLTMAITWVGFTSISQVICSVQSPASIAGNYDFTWATPANGDWSTPNFLTPGVYVEDTLMLVDDGTPGLNPEGNPNSAQGCSPLLNNLTGKIAVIYRNVCEFGAKAKNAQDAGAVGVIIINREPDVIAMGGGAQGTNVTIPVVMVNDATGALLVNAMLEGTVVVFLGNKTGLFNHDAGIQIGRTLLPKSTAMPAILAQDSSEFNFELGTKVFNYGILAQTNATLIATVEGPAGTVVFSDSVSGISVASGDSVDIYPGQANSLNQFYLPTYAAGKYKLTYTLLLSTPDQYNSDNVVTTYFVLNDTIFTYANTDVTTNLPVSNNGYRPNNNNSSFSSCLTFRDPNASRIGIAGVYFSASTAAASNIDLTDEEIGLTVYKWEDDFMDLDDTQFGFNILTPISFGYYYYPSNLQSTTVFGKLNTPVVLEDNQRYLVCTQTTNLSVYLGFDTKTDYTTNSNFYAQPITQVENDGTYFAIGFGADITGSIGLRTFEASELGINQNTTIEGMVYPNPASDVVTVSVQAEGNAMLTITDVTGKVAATKALNLVNGQDKVSMEELEPGLYFFNLVLENGLSTKISVVKR
jgi:hypothetical protein